MRLSGLKKQSNGVYSTKLSGLKMHKPPKLDHYFLIPFPIDFGSSRGKPQRTALTAIKTQPSSDKIFVEPQRTAA